jgi:8-oxo-dGTP pyrophosphatase MutT (NUDIX family)
MWQVTSSRIAYENPWIQVVEDQVVGPDGAPGLYGVVELKHPAVFVVAVNERDEVLLETVDRHTVGPSLEIPAGGSDGEDLLAAAKRELYEETGYAAEHWQSIGSMDALNGVCRAPEHVFLAPGSVARGRGRGRDRRRDQRCVVGPVVGPDGHGRRRHDHGR